MLTNIKNSSTSTSASPLLLLAADHQSSKTSLNHSTVTCSSLAKLSLDYYKKLFQLYNVTENHQPIKPLEYKTSELVPQSYIKWSNDMNLCFKSNLRKTASLSEDTSIIKAISTSIKTSTLKNLSSDSTEEKITDNLIVKSSINQVKDDNASKPKSERNINYDSAVNTDMCLKSDKMNNSLKPKYSSTCVFSELGSEKLSKIPFCSVRWHQVQYEDGSSAIFSESGDLIHKEIPIFTEVKSTSEQKLSPQKTKGKKNKTKEKVTKKSTNKNKKSLKSDKKNKKIEENEKSFTCLKPMKKSFGFSRKILFSIPAQNANSFYPVEILQEHQESLAEVENINSHSKIGTDVSTNREVRCL